MTKSYFNHIMVRLIFFKSPSTLNAYKINPTDFTDIHETIRANQCQSVGDFYPYKLCIMNYAL